MIAPSSPAAAEALDLYFRTQAGQDVRRRLASCFVVIADRATAPIGFYTLSSASVIMADLPEAVAKRLPRYPVAPATLIGRLAVDARHRRRGVGELMLLDAFSRILRGDIASFTVVVDAKDEAAEAFYRSYGFQRLPKISGRMFMPVAEVAKLFV